MKTALLVLGLIAAGGSALATSTPSGRPVASPTDRLSLVRTPPPARSVGEAVRDKLRLQLRAAHLPDQVTTDAERARLKREIAALDEEIRLRIVPPSGP